MVYFVMPSPTCHMQDSEKGSPRELDTQSNGQYMNRCCYGNIENDCGAYLSCPAHPSGSHTSLQDAVANSPNPRESSSRLHFLSKHVAKWEVMNDMSNCLSQHRCFIFAGPLPKLA
jgi:hypothetical protein